MFNFGSYIIKNCEISEKKEILQENHQTNHYLEYFHKFVDAMNIMMISMHKNSTVFINKFALNYFRSRFEIIDGECTIDNLNDSSINVSEFYLKDFFGSLMLKTKSRKDSLNHEENTQLQQILSRITSSKIVSKNFSYIGNFISSGSNSNCYAVYFRILKLKEEVECIN